MRTYRFVALTVVIVCLFTVCSQAQRRSQFIYGINGHPLTQEAYKGTISTQIQLVKKLNCRFYRVDVPVNASGTVINASAFLSFLTQMKAHGIRVLPVLVFGVQAYADRSPEKAYAEGLLYGRTFARQYKTFFDYYEVGNEEDNQSIAGQVHGNLPVYFDTPKAKVIAPYLKGVCEAIRKEDRSAKIIINFTWVHYGFLHKLVQAKVPFDRVGIHWYSDMGDLQKAGAGFGNVIDTVYRLFRKPIWVTEINVRDGVPLKADAAKENWLKRNLNFLRKSSVVEAVFIYELLDQPVFAIQNNGGVYNPAEATYGLNAWLTTNRVYKSVKEKPLFNQYKSFIKKYP